MGVKLKVVGARKLKKSGMFGKADPYVTISYGELKFKSQVVKNNLNPEWNFDNIFTVSDKISNEILLEVYDKDTASKDDFMGKISLLRSEITKLEQGKWIPLQGTKSGEIFVACEIVTDANVSAIVDDKQAKVFAGQPEISEHLAEREKSRSKSKTPDNAQNNKSLDSSTNKEKAVDAQTTDKEDAEKKTSIPDSSSQHSDLKAGESLLKEKPLKLTVVAARKLKKSGLFGKADPYVAITYGSQKKTGQV